MINILSESIAFDLVAIFATFIFGVILFYKWKLSYWDNLGIPTLPATIPFGNTKGLFLGRKTMGEEFRDLYVEFKSKGYNKHGGFYMAAQPFYFPIDPELLKSIMQKDFQHFVNHGGYLNEEVDPLSGHLFALEDAKWRNMRVKLTPTFTSGKMKMMFQTFADCAAGLKDIMDDAALNHAPVDIKDILGRFSTDVIGSVAFGLECNSLKDPDTEFRTYGRKAFEVDTVQRIKTLISFILPRSLLNALKFKLIQRDVEKFFMRVIRDTVDYREKNKIYRKDFMHLLLQLKNRGSVADDERITDEHGKTSEKALTMNELAAQSFVFFLAGFETSSTTMTFALYELAINPDVQEKLREEINDVLGRHQDKLSYEAIMEMTYMEKVLNETLRKHPPAPFLNRICTQDYTIPETDILLKKGTQVAISVLGLHRDPKYYPDPEKFDPERFSEENKNSRPAYTWIPFGDGPRICIGLRFGMMQSKVGLTTLLKNYKIKLSKKTPLPLKLDKKSFITAAAGGIWLDVEKLD